MYQYSGPYSRRRYSNAGIVGTFASGKEGTAKFHQLNLSVNDASLGKVVVRIASSNVAVKPGNEISRKTGDFPHGTSLNIAAVPAASAKFERWSDGVTTPSRTIIMLADMSLEAVFSVKGAPVVNKTKYTLTTSAVPETGGKVTGGNVTVEKGDTVVLKATQNAGYKFVRFDSTSSNVVSQNSAASRGADELRVTVNADTHVTAVFAKEGQGSTNGGDTNTGGSGGGGNGGFGGGGGGVSTGEVIAPGTISASTAGFDGIITLLRKYWWAVAIVVILFDDKGGSK